MNRAITILLRVILGSVFLAAGIPKVGAPLETLAAIYSYQIVLPDWFASAIAHLLPWVEIGIGLALLAGACMPVTLALTAFVLLVFTALTAQAWWRGLDIDCGCLDLTALHPALAALTTPGGAALRNIVLLGLTGLLGFLLRRQRSDTA